MQSKPELPKNEFLDALMATPKLFGTKAISPDTKWVAWTWGNIGPCADIYLAPTDGSAKPVKVTDFKQNTSTVSWSSDSRSFIVMHDYDGDERYRLYQIKLSDLQNPVPLIDEHPNYFLRGGQLGPDGNSLFYGATYDFETNQEIDVTIIYKHDLSTNRRTVLVRPEKSYYTRPFLDSKGTRIIYPRSEHDPSGYQFWMMNSDGTDNKEILNFGDKVKVSASWHPNGTDIIFTAEEKGYRKVGMINADTLAIKWLIDDPSRNIEDAFVPYGSTDALIVEIEQAQEKPSLLNLETLTEEKIVGQKTTLPLARTEKGWLCLYRNAQQPQDLVLVDPKGNRTNITDAFNHMSYRAQDLARAESITWKSSDSTTIQGWLYRASGEPKGTIVQVHGGPTSHSEDLFQTDIQFFVSQGFNVFDPNYRGSTGFNLEFEELIKKDGWGGLEQQDILTGIQHLIEQRIAQPYRIGISGTSYGGYSSWFAITHFSPEFVKAAAPICGMTDLVVDYNTTRPDLRGYSEEMLGGSPEQVPQKYHDASPINFIENIQGNLLIVQGAKDPNVTMDNVRSVEKVLNQFGKNYETLIFEDEGHGISKPGNKKRLLLGLVTFFAESFGS